jgi:hypothetical protein
LIRLILHVHFSMIIYWIFIPFYARNCKKMK